MSFFTSVLKINPSLLILFRLNRFWSLFTCTKARKRYTDIQYRPPGLKSLRVLTSLSCNDSIHVRVSPGHLNYCIRTQTRVDRRLTYKGWCGSDKRTKSIDMTVTCRRHHQSSRRCQHRPPKLINSRGTNTSPFLGHSTTPHLDSG